MRILIVSGYFTPQITPRAFRTTELALEFGRMGHSVKVVVPYSDYDYSALKKDNPNIELSFYDKATSEPPKSRLRYCIWRIWGILTEFPETRLLFSMKRILKDESGYDLLVSIAVPHQIHWGIARIWKSRKIATNWVADCGDPFMFAASAGRNKPFYFRYFERNWCRLCTFITVPTPGAVNAYYPEFRDKIRVIPQAFNFDEVRLADYHPHEVPTFAYFGTFVVGNTDPRPFLDHLLATGRKFKFCVYTSQKNLFESYSERMGDMLELHDFLPRPEAIRMMSQFDFLLYFPYRNAVQKPSKLIDYSLSGRPVLSLYPYDIDTGILDSFMNGDYSDSMKIGDIEEYNIKNVAAEFLSLVR